MKRKTGVVTIVGVLASVAAGGVFLLFRSHEEPVPPSAGRQAPGPHTRAESAQREPTTETERSAGIVDRVIASDAFKEPTQSKSNRGAQSPKPPISLIDASHIVGLPLERLVAEIDSAMDLEKFEAATASSIAEYKRRDDKKSDRAMVVARRLAESGRYEVVKNGGKAPKLSSTNEVAVSLIEEGPDGVAVHRLVRVGRGDDAELDGYMDAVEDARSECMMKVDEALRSLN